MASEAAGNASKRRGAGHWQRFESIPSSMFFALLTLNKKNPLAHATRLRDEVIYMCRIDRFGHIKPLKLVELMMYIILRPYSL